MITSIKTKIITESQLISSDKLGSDTLSINLENLVVKVNQKHRSKMTTYILNKKF